MAALTDEIIHLLSDSDEEVIPVQMANDNTGEESDEELCCPVSEECYQEKGPQQVVSTRKAPLVLPLCGHTFSRETILSLFTLHKGKRILCPLCNAKQSTVRKIDGCPPNWDTIRRVERNAEKRTKIQVPEQGSTVGKSMKKVKKATVSRKAAQHETSKVEVEPPAVPIAEPSDEDKSQLKKKKKKKKNRSKESSGSHSGEVAVTAKVMKKKKKVKASTTGKAQPMSQSPLLEKVAKAEFEERAVRVLGQAHKQRRQ